MAKFKPTNPEPLTADEIRAHIGGTSPDYIHAHAGHTIQAWVGEYLILRIDGHPPVVLTKYRD